MITPHDPKNLTSGEPVMSREQARQFPSAGDVSIRIVIDDPLADLYDEEGLPRRLGGIANELSKNWMTPEQRAYWEDVCRRVLAKRLTMQGTRLADDVDWSGALPAGSYWKREGRWLGLTPNGLLAGLGNHQVEEHEDGTITVSPSILTKGSDREWHGYLEHGVWRAV